MNHFPVEILQIYGKSIPWAMLIGFAADLVFGDPRGMWHPVCLIGTLIAGLEKKIRRIFPKSREGELAGGVVLVILTLFCSTAVPLAALVVAFWIHRIAGFALMCYMCWTIPAARSLRKESMKVADALCSGDLEAGRKAVSMIVGRDTQHLDGEGVAKAAVETVAENTSDGVIAPLLFSIVGGPVLGYFYKAANTMDSMVGYKNDRYLYFGRAAARLDDAVNFLPARLSALLMIAVCGLCGMDTKGAVRIFRRDRKKHASPNSAQTESVMAGALGVQLAGDAWYFGERHIKPTIGDDFRPVGPKDIRWADRLMYAAGIFGVLLFAAVRLLLAAGFAAV